jgi:small-conductance mechanosensitive channel/CRP-like cAMP-binding protein
MNQLREWLGAQSAHSLLSPTVGAVLLVAVLALRAGLRRTRVGRRLDWAMTLIVVGILLGEVAALSPDHGGLFLWAQAGFVAAVAIGVVRTLLVLFVDFYLHQRRGAGVSAIVRDVGSALVYFIIILLVLLLILDINLASLVATSAVLTAIVGLAFQDVLGSVISGLVLELEDPFGPDDWIHVGRFEGQVVETGWRTTRIRTRVNELVTLPNTYLAREPVVNYSRPDARYGDTLRFHAAYEAPPYAVKEAVTAVLAADNAVLRTPEIEVRTTAYGDRGVEYAIRYWIDDFKELERTRDRIMTNLWYALRRADIRIPVTTGEIFMRAELPEPNLARGDLVATLGGVPLLAALPPEALQQLAASSHRLIFASGEIIVREGESGSSFYVIERGRVRVVLGQVNGHGGRVIAHLGPRDFFGEMSLLAGEPRSATVVADEDTVVVEVGRHTFQEIVAASPTVLEPISAAAAERLAEQQELRQMGERTDEPVPSADSVLQRIRVFFGLASDRSVRTDRSV